MTKFIVCWKYGAMAEDLVFQHEGEGPSPHTCILYS